MEIALNKFNYIQSVLFSLLWYDRKLPWFTVGVYKVSGIGLHTLHFTYYIAW